MYYLAAILVAGGFAFMHSTPQTWATEVLPKARASVVSFFANAVFAGSAVATAAPAPLAEARSFGPLFAIAGLSAVLLGFVGCILAMIDVSALSEGVGLSVAVQYYAVICRGVRRYNGVSRVGRS